jgi:hypothetical protein
VCDVDVMGTRSILIIIRKVASLARVHPTLILSRVGTCLTYTGLFGELEHLKIETRLIDKKFASVMGECVI